MEGNTPCRKTTLTQPESSGRKGKSELGWLYSVLKDLGTLKETAWCKKPQGGSLWITIIKEAKACKGL
jgi:hypothetical protein